MANFRCNSCDGVYTTPQADGSVYFHRCAPVRNPGTGRIEERANVRDENLVRLQGRGEGTTRSEGAGRSPSPTAPEA